MQNKQSGFTILEVLLAVAMLGIIAAITASLGSGFIWRTDLLVSKVNTVSSLRRAQILSQAGVADSGWGVKVEDSTITIFAGPSFNLRDTNYDEVIELDSTNFTESNEIVFSKILGIPEVAKTISLEVQGNTADIVINTKGMIEY